MTDPTICTCACHRERSVIHFAACCHPCLKCHQNVSVQQVALGADGIVEYKHEAFCAAENPRLMMVGVNDAVQVRDEPDRRMRVVVLGDSLNNYKSGLKIQWSAADHRLVVDYPPDTTVDFLDDLTRLISKCFRDGNVPDDD